tara:strand:- start:287 stop:532 length:246 start_codon:yes stop_codon:yes gene_type:complete
VEIDVVVYVVNLQSVFSIRSSIVGFGLGLIENELRLALAVMNFKDATHLPRTLIFNFSREGASFRRIAWHVAVIGSVRLLF